MALEVVTDGNLGMKKKLKRITRNMFTRKEHWTGLVFCFVCRLLFVLIDNKCILSCAIVWSKMAIERKQRRTENETVVFISS